LRIFLVLKIEEPPKIRFRTREGFCLTSLEEGLPGYLYLYSDCSTTWQPRLHSERIKCCRVVLRRGGFKQQVLDLRGK
jgi:hypothetical protein